MPTFNVLERTLFIRATAYGTAFALDVDNRQYLVTARHLVEGLEGPLKIKYFHGNEWIDLHCELLGLGRGEADVAVLAPATQLADPGLPLPLAVGEFHLGQDVFFVGYPYMQYMQPTPFLPGKVIPF
jgi:hypothetical protein